MLNAMRYFLLFLCLLCSLSNAQEKPKKHTCRILFLDRPSGAPTKMFLFHGTGALEVELPGMNLSPVYELPAGPLNLMLLPEAPLDFENPPPGAPGAKVLETTLDFYLLVLSDPSNKVAPVRLQVVDASAQRLQKGHTLWFNLSDLLIGGRLGSEKLVIQPKSSVVMRPPRSDAGDYQVSFAYRKKGVDENYPICETLWVHNPLNRNLGFIIPKEGSRTPKVMMIPDFRAEPKKDEADVP